MFVQMFTRVAKDSQAARKWLERWESQLSRDAVGWTGTTAGITEEGWLVAFVGFESEESARRNSARPEQTEWWASGEQIFDGQAQFYESSDVLVDNVGDTSGAGFVQIMQGRNKDPERARELFASDPTKWAAFRPDILGTTVAVHDDGAYTMAVYFTSEAAAREGEQKEPPAELVGQMKEMEALSDGMPVFHDLRDPWIFTPS